MASWKDSIYQNALRNFQKVKKSSNAAYWNERRQNQADLKIQNSGINRTKDEDLQNIRNNFGGRGMVRSSGFLQGNNQYLGMLAQKLAETRRGFDRAENTNLLRKQSTVDAANMQEEQAKLDAIRRRNARGVL
jgi:hypothetical protein